MVQRIRFIQLAVYVAVTMAMLSCKKEEQYMNNAEIWPDNRAYPCLTNDPCNCPAGFFVFIDSVRNSNGNFTWKTLELPANFNIPTNTNEPHLPIAVKIDWRYDTARCNNYIDILKIEKR